MAVIKRIVVLANSVENSGRCLAGKELIWKREDYEVGSWIRVVGNEDGAEVQVSWMLEQLGREPRLLDVIDVPLEGIVPPGRKVRRSKLRFLGGAFDVRLPLRHVESLTGVQQKKKDGRKESVNC